MPIGDPYDPYDWYRDYRERVRTSRLDYPDWSGPFVVSTTGSAPPTPILSIEELRELLRRMDSRPLDEPVAPGRIEAAPLATGRRKIRV